MGVILEVLAGVLVVVAVVGSILFLAGGRGKKLKCPECGNVFPAPAFDNKRTGLGWTFPYTGVVKCPKCGQSRARRDYQKAAASAPVPT